MVEKDNRQGRSTGTVITSGGANDVHNTIDVAHVATWHPHWAGWNNWMCYWLKVKKDLISIGIFTASVFLSSEVGELASFSNVCYLPVQLGHAKL
jgi:hypothetical protein